MPNTTRQQWTYQAVGCEICGKPPSPYPTWIISKGHPYHIGCLTEEYRQLKAAHNELVHRANVAGIWGPWHDEWGGSYDAQHWGDE